MEKVNVQIHDKKGKTKGKVDLPASVFDLEWNADLVHQVLVAMQANQRAGTAHTKDRAEVSGTGKKPWKQKGTGNARHGSRRSPIWVGGGIAHGPRSDRDYSQKINKKMKNKALFIALSSKLRDNQILFVDSLELSDAKTKNAQEVITALSSVKGFETLDTKKNPNNIFVVMPNKNIDLEKSFQNLSNVTVTEARSLNMLHVANHRYLVIVDPETCADTLLSRLEKGETKAVVTK